MWADDAKDITTKFDDIDSCNKRTENSYKHYRWFLSSVGHTKRLSDARCLNIRIYPDTFHDSILPTRRSYHFDDGDTFGNGVELWLAKETTQPTTLSTATDKKFFSISKI